MDHALIEKGVRFILKGLDCDTRDRNYAETPERYARALSEMFTPKETEWATFPESYADFILLRGHTLWSLCPHHLLPVHLQVFVAYIPNGEVLGLSKLARVLHECNPGPTLQEGFTRTVCDRLHSITPSNHGVACLVVGEHGCMRLRGIKSSADVVTFAATGEFQTDNGLRDRFFQLTGLHNGKH